MQHLFGNKCNKISEHDNDFFNEQNPEIYDYTLKSCTIKVLFAQKLSEEKQFPLLGHYVEYIRVLIECLLKVSAYYLAELINKCGLRCFITAAHLFSTKKTEWR